MDKSNLILLTLWAIQAVRQTLIWVYFLQLKEYRLDRFQVLIEGNQGRNNLEVKSIIYKFAVIFLALFLGIYWPAYLLFIWLSVKFLVEIKNKTRRLPVFTLRAVEILGTSIAGIAIVVFLSLHSGIVASNLSFGEMLLLALPFIGVAWTTPLVNKSKNEITRKAKDRIKIVKPIVIGITGSFGKSTTKEFIAHILSAKYKVEKTEKNQNTDWGVAKKATELEKDTQIFVAELGAYKIGEIKTSANIINPQIGILTGIEPQHLALFGSVENIKTAKYELVESLPKNGIAVFNVTNPECEGLAKRAASEGRKVLTYRVGQGLADITATLKSISQDSIVLKVKSNKKETEIIAPIRGAHFAENLLGAILVARHMGMDWEQIKKAVKTINSLGKTMNVYKTKSGATIIDDSYNSTPIGFKSALDYLASFGGRRKILVTSGIIELGSQTDKIHNEIAAKADGIADEVILTNNDFEKDFSSLKNKLQVKKGQDLLDRVKYHLWQDCVILVEGRMPISITKELEKQKK